MVAVAPDLAPAAERQATQVRDEVTPNLSLFWGVNPVVAAMVAEKTGDPLPDKFSTFGWVGPDNRSFVAIISGEVGEMAKVSFWSEGLRLSRPILETLRAFIFDNALSAGVRVVVHGFDDPAKVHALHRLGFRTFRVADDGRLVLILHPANLPPAWRRARLRKAN